MIKQNLFFFVENVILPNDTGIYGYCAINICLMLYEYMGKGTKIYGKCVKKYMGGVPLGCDTRPAELPWE